MAPKIILDLKGVISPLDLLKCKSRLNIMDRGEVLEVLLGDEDVAQTLETIIRRSGDEVVYTETRVQCICLGIKKGTGRPYSGQ